MEGSFIGMILLQVALIALNAIFASAEIAVISVSDAKLAHLAAQGDKRAVRLAQLTSQPARFLATIQVAITLSGFLGSAFAAENFSDLLVDWLLAQGVPVPAATLDAIAVVFITLVLSYFTLIFGELVPKRVAMRKAEELALGISGLISAIAKVFAPIVWFLTLSTNTVLRLLGIDPNAEEEPVGEEEIRMMVDAGGEKGTIDPEEKQFIQNVFEFDDLTAGEIATHRTELTLLWAEESDRQWAETIRSSWHTLYPVCGKSADDVLGILNAKDYFRLEDQSREAVMEAAVKPAYFVPETVKADLLFRNMKQARQRLSVVLDEHGGMVGIVTISDLVERLVGDLNYDPDEPDVIPLIEAAGPGVWQVQGDAPLDALAEAMGLALPDKEYDDLNGLVFSALAAIPQDGATVRLTAAGLEIQVTEIRDHQVVSALVQRAKDPAVPEPKNSGKPRGRRGRGEE